MGRKHMGSKNTVGKYETILNFYLLTCIALSITARAIFGVATLIMAISGAAT